MRFLSPEMKNYLNKGMRTEIQNFFLSIGKLIFGICASIGFIFLIFRVFDAAAILYIIGIIMFIIYTVFLGGIGIRKRRRIHREILINGIEVDYKLLEVGQNPKKRDRQSRRPQLVFQIELDKEIVEISSFRFDLEFVMIAEPEGTGYYFPSNYPNVFIPSGLLAYHMNPLVYRSELNLSGNKKMDF